MIVLTCVDEHMGMLFHHRRQSMDAVLRKRIVSVAAGKKLWMNAYSAKQFAGESVPQLQVEEQFLSKAAAGEVCFLETDLLGPYEKKIEKLILYHWNRTYPYDTKLDLDCANWHLVQSAEFPGHSHEKITEEIYVPK